VRPAIWWRTLFELAPDPCFLLDRDGVFLDWNPAAEALTLLTRDDAVGRPIQALGLLDATERVLGIESRLGASGGAHLRYGFTLDTKRAAEELGFRSQYRIGLARAGDGALRLETASV